MNVHVMDDLFPEPEDGIDIVKECPGDDTCTMHDTKLYVIPDHLWAQYQALMPGFLEMADEMDRIMNEQDEQGD